MRLRLAVRRHGLPDAHILWSSDGLHSAQESNSKKPTIAQFLNELNEVLPLESEDWGLEDYVVEVGGFECVHFSPLDSVLKEDDQVVIRPLELNDRRFRRVSGRLQIAADGRRLYDGVAFGRPFLRRIARPPVRIPSAKRPRISYDQDDEDDLDAPNQLVLQDYDSEEQDEDYHDDDISQEEIATLAAENVRSEQKINGISYAAQRHRTRGPTRNGLGIQVSPRTSANVSFGSSTNRRPSSGGSSKNVRFEQEELDTPATVLALDEEDEDDHDFEDDADGSYGSESNKENITPPESIALAPVQPSTHLGSEAESDLWTSSSGSSSDNESDSSSEDESSETSFLNVDSSEQTTDQDEESFAKKPNQLDNFAKVIKQSADTLAQIKQKNMAQKSSSATNQPRQEVPHGQGKTQTRRRNKRRRIKQQYERAEKAAQSIESTVVTDLVEEVLQKTPDNLVQPGDVEDDLDARKAALLKRITPESSSQVREAQQVTPAEEYTTIAGVDANTTMETIQCEIQKSQTPAEQHSQVELSRNSDTVEELRNTSTSPRKATLDIGSANRMLFNSLGIRAPKSKEEAAKLRDMLRENAKNIPGSLTSLPETAGSNASPAAVESDRDDESWKDKIQLSAVECCYDGVEYSAPPFPFVQRWDPQQRWSNKRKSKRGGGGRNKRQKRDQQDYYQNDHDDQGYYNHGQSYEEEFTALETGANATGTDEGMPIDVRMDAANHQLWEESQYEDTTTDKQDLPELPEDVSVLQALTSETATVGSIIAFKQMEMSEQTGWCPVISDYKTAKIEAVLENDVLGIIFAARDNPQKAKHYDEETGERVYAKFEMPDDSDDADMPLHLEIGLQDMIEPKLVQAGEADEAVMVEQVIDSALQDVSDVVAEPIAVETSITTTNTLVGDASHDADPDAIEHKAHDTVEIEEVEDVEILIDTDTKRVLDKEPSIELGSSNPPQRFFSETPSVEESVAPIKEAPQPVDEPYEQPEEHEDFIPFGNDDDEIEFPEATQDSQMPEAGDKEELLPKDSASAIELNHVPAADIEPELPIPAGQPVADPSIWEPAVETNDNDATKFYSAGIDESVNEPASSPPPPLLLEVRQVANGTGRSFGEDGIINSSIKIEKTVVARVTSPELPIPVEQEKAPKNDTDVIEPSQILSDNDKNVTIAQGSVKQEMSAKEKRRQTRSIVKGYFDSQSDDSDSSSSSVPSIGTLLSQQPIERPVSPPRLSAKKKRTSKYPKSLQAVKEADSFVFSQAPKRLLSDTHKIVVGMNGGSFELDSDNGLANEPAELEAQSQAPTELKSDSAQPELPATSTTPRDKKRSRTSLKAPAASQPTGRNSKKKTASAPNNNKGEVIDLTLSSDPVEPDDSDVGGARRVASQMPSGSKRASKTGSGRTKPRLLKRTKSLV